jgi:hypothetical protein
MGKLHGPPDPDRPGSGGAGGLKSSEMSFGHDLLPRHSWWCSLLTFKEKYDDEQDAPSWP